MTSILVYLAVYILPTYILVSTGVDTFLRNPRKIEYQLLAGILFVISLLFLEEFVRQLLPVSSSALLVAFLFGNLGALTSALVVHFYMHITGWIKRMPRIVAVTISYLPVVPVLLTLILRRNIFNSVAFTRIGIWIQPEYNARYYIAMWLGVVVMVLMSVLMYVSARQAASLQAKKRLFVVFYATLFNTVWSVFTGGFTGYVVALRYLPPYSYIYGLVGWVLLIRWAMFRYDFLPSHERKYRTLFNLAPVAILTVDEQGSIVETNPKAREIFGEKASQWDDLTVESDTPVVTNWLQSHFAALDRVEDEEMELVSQDGTVLTTVVDTEFLDVHGRGLLLIAIRDMTERILSEREHRKLALYDSLSELPNRVHFNRVLNEAILQSSKSSESFGVILLDVDNFKQINDSFGHLVGDAVIQHVGRGLQDALAGEGVAARLGGDEFVSIIHSVSGVQQMENVGEAITKTLSVPCAIDGHEIPVSVSIGFSLFPDDGQTQYELIKQADMRMYSSKNVEASSL